MKYPWRRENSFKSRLEMGHVVFLHLSDSPWQQFQKQADGLFVWDGEVNWEKSLQERQTKQKRISVINLKLYNLDGNDHVRESPSVNVWIFLVSLLSCGNLQDPMTFPWHWSHTPCLLGQKTKDPHTSATTPRKGGWNKSWKRKKRKMKTRWSKREQEKGWTFRWQ